jgi:hypothetical protein
MDDSLKKRLRDNLLESDYGVAQDLKYEKVRKEVMGAMETLINNNISVFGDRHSAMGAVLGVIEKLYL